MARKRAATERTTAKRPAAPPTRAARPSLLDTRIIYCGDRVDQLAKLPDACVDHLHLWHRFPTGEFPTGEFPTGEFPTGEFPAGDANSNRNYEVFCGERSEPRTQVRGPLPAFEDRHASTAAYIDYVLAASIPHVRATFEQG